MHAVARVGYASLVGQLDVDEGAWEKGKERERRRREMDGPGKSLRKGWMLIATPLA